MKFCEYKNNNF